MPDSEKKQNQNPDKESKQDKQIERLERELAQAEQNLSELKSQRSLNEQKKNNKKEESEEKLEEKSKTLDEEILRREEEIESIRKRLIAALQQNQQGKKHPTVNENGEVTGEYEFKMGEQGPSGMFLSSALEVEDIRKTFQQFQALGFQIKIETKGANQFCGIVCPEGYKDNINPMTMTPEQIDSALNCLRNEKREMPEKKPDIFSLTSGTDPKEIIKFRDEVRGSWVEQIKKERNFGKTPGSTAIKDTIHEIISNGPRSSSQTNGSSHTPDR